MKGFFPSSKKVNEALSWMILLVEWQSKPMKQSKDNIFIQTIIWTLLKVYKYWTNWFMDNWKAGSSSIFTSATLYCNFINLWYSCLTTEKVELTEEDVVPGDVFIIHTNGCSMTCDAALLSGNCIVNESMLTGKNTIIVLELKTAKHKWTKRTRRICMQPLVSHY